MYHTIKQTLDLYRSVVFPSQFTEQFLILRRDNLFISFHQHCSLKHTIGQSQGDGVQLFYSFKITTTSIILYCPCPVSLCLEFFSVPLFYFFVMPLSLSQPKSRYFICLPTPLFTLFHTSHFFSFFHSLIMTLII